MKDLYTIYNNKKEPIAVLHEKYTKKFLNAIKDAKTASNYTKPESINQWFQIKQPKDKIIGYFQNLKYASKFLKGEFYSDRVRE
jgi:hypothetical protein